nr:MAG TPA: hypothetical protein [Caudoviricetes sp.]
MLIFRLVLFKNNNGYYPKSWSFYLGTLKIFTNFTVPNTNYTIHILILCNL